MSIPEYGTGRHEDYLTWQDEQRDAAEPTPGQAVAQPDDPYGGHEFAYESHTDLFRCVKCHVYEVVARKDDGTIEPCAGEPPAGSEPIEVNAW